MKIAASVANLAAAALLGVVLAYWSWAWLAPPAAARAPAAAELSGAGGASAAGGLFGTATEAAAASSNVRLMGVLAASSGRRGQAVMRLDAKQTVAVLEGEEVEPGLRLAEVHVDHIVLERNGARETVAWPVKNAK
jgi:general secretion pathway protein C